MDQFFLINIVLPFFLFSRLNTASTKHTCVVTWSRREAALVELAAPLLILRKNWRSKSLEMFQYFRNDCLLFEIQYISIKWHSRCCPVQIFLTLWFYFSRYRKMNKRLVTRLPVPGGLMPDDGLPLDVAVTRKPSPLTNGSGGATMLIPRSTEPVTFELLRKPMKLDAGSPSAPGSPPDVWVVLPSAQLLGFKTLPLQLCFFPHYSLDPVPKPGMALSSHTMPHPRMPADHHSAVKHMPGVTRGSPVYPQTQIPEMCYDNRIPPSASQYEPPQFSTGTALFCNLCIVPFVSGQSHHFIIVNFLFSRVCLPTAICPGLHA